jgi:hypothetical protein
MPSYKINVSKRPDIKIPGFTGEQMHEIGERAIEVIKERLHSGVNVFDQTAKPLARIEKIRKGKVVSSREAYAKYKQRIGRQPIRDLLLKGDLQKSIEVNNATENHVKVAIKDSKQYAIGILNQNIDPWFGLSEKDDVRITDEVVRPLFSLNLADALK